MDCGLIVTEWPGSDHARWGQAERSVVIISLWTGISWCVYLSYVYDISMSVFFEDLMVNFDLFCCRCVRLFLLVPVTFIVYVMFHLVLCHKNAQTHRWLHFLFWTSVQLVSQLCLHLCIKSIFVSSQWVHFQFFMLGCHDIRDSQLHREKNVVLSEARRLRTWTVGDYHPFTKTDQSWLSVFYIWNFLSESVVERPSLMVFKSRLKIFLFVRDFSVNLTNCR